MAGLSDIQRESLLRIAAGNTYSVRLNTSRSLRSRGLLVNTPAVNVGHSMVSRTVLSEAALALFDGQKFQVVYFAEVNGRIIKRVWTAGIDLTKAIAEVVDLRDLGTSDPDCIKQFRIEVV